MTGCYLIYVVTVQPDATLQRAEAPVGIVRDFFGSHQEKCQRARKRFGLAAHQTTHLVEISTKLARRIDRAISREAAKGRTIGVAHALDILRAREARREACVKDARQR